MRKPSHECPPYCHLCPDIDRVIRQAGREPEPGEAVMPSCWSNLHASADWKAMCVCEKITRDEFNLRQREIAELEDYLATLRVC